MVACFRYNFCVEICDFGINTTVASQFNSIWFRQFGHLLHHKIVQSCVCLVFSGKPNNFDSDVRMILFFIVGENWDILLIVSYLRFGFCTTRSRQASLSFIAILFPLNHFSGYFPQYFSCLILSRNTFLKYFPAILFPLNDFSGYHFLFFTHHILVTTKYSHKWENCIPNRRW